MYHFQERRAFATNAERASVTKDLGSAFDVLELVLLFPHAQISWMYLEVLYFGDARYSHLLPGNPFEF